MGFRKVVLRLEILADDDEHIDALIEHENLNEIAYAINDGPFVGKIDVIENTAVTAAVMAKEMIRLRADPEFFGLTESGQRSQET